LIFEDRRIKHENCYICRYAIVDVVNRYPTHGIACASSSSRSREASVEYLVHAGSTASNNTDANRAEKGRRSLVNARGSRQI
jgi:hypothetical protein